MSRDVYEQLIRDFCEEVRFADVSHVLRGDPLIMDEVEICLVYDEERDAQSVYAMFDLGPLPDAEEAPAFYAALLDLGLRSFLTGGPAVGLSAGAGRALVMERLPLATLDCTLLHAVLRALAQRTQAWREEREGVRGP